MPDHVDRINQEYGTNYTKTYSLYPDGTPYPDGTASNPVSNRFPGVFPDLMQEYTMPDGSIRNVSAPYEIRPNDIIGGFFQTGETMDHAISLSGGSEKGTVNAGFSNTNQGGVVPNQFVRRTLHSSLLNLGLLHLTTTSVVEVDLSTHVYFICQETLT